MEIENAKSDHSFIWFNATQFLGALNDNIFKLLVIYYLIGDGDEKYAAKVQPVAQALTVVPFILLLAYAGRLADRYSKRNLIIWCKAAELFVMLFAVIAFWTQNDILLGLVLLLMYMQSTFFSPNKYGIIRELVPDDKVKSATGKVQAFTYIAILLGLVLAPVLKEKLGGHNVLAALVCVMVAAMGLAISFAVKSTKSAGGHSNASVLFVRDIMKTLWSIHRKKILIWSIIGSVYFTFVGISMYLCVIPYGMGDLNLTKEESTLLFVFALIGISAGSLLSGKYRSKSGDYQLITFGTVLMGMSALLIGAFRPGYHFFSFLLFSMGAGAGLFVVPIKAFIQIKSPNQRRGEIIASSEFLGWVSNLIAIGVFLFLTQLFGFNSAEFFIFSAIIALTVGLILLCRSSVE